MIGKPRLRPMSDHVGLGWYCAAPSGFAVWGRTPQIAYENWRVWNHR